MGIESKIQWTDATWNPWHGCKKVSTGCMYCYMYRDKERWNQDPTTVLKSVSNFNQPLKWKEGKLIFTCSWSDWFIEEADEWRDEAWAIIKATPQHTYQILTKRPERIRDHLPADWGRNGYSNVWIGVSAEDMVTYCLRTPYMHGFPAVVKFISAEPLLGPIDMDMMFHNFDWVIVGGESGSLNPKAKYRARECEVVWMDAIVAECKTAGVPVFVKQFGTFLAKQYGFKDRHGGDIKEFPQILQVRQMPINYQKQTT